MSGSGPVRTVARLWWLSIYNGSGLVPVPRDSPSIRSGRDDACRVLLLGNGAAGGWRVSTYGLALAGRLVGALQQRLQRGCDLDQVGDEVMNLRGAAAWLGDRPLEPYDVVLVVVGVSDAVRLTPVADWTDDLTGLLERLLVRTRPEVQVVVTGIEPIRMAGVFRGPLGALAQRHADRLNAATEEVVDRFDRVRFAPLSVPRMSGEPESRASAVYAAWAAGLAPVVADALEDAGGAERPPLPAVPPVGHAPTEVPAAWAPMRTLLDRAKSALHADVAWISLVDGGRYTVPVASIGNAPAEVPLDLTYCVHTMQQDGAMVVPDRRRDERFRDNPFLDVVRFESYAGHPLRASDGSTIGTLCVASIRPRRRSPRDVEALGGYAEEAQSELARIGDRVEG